MAGKRYSAEEIAKIVELKDSGKTFEEVSTEVGRPVPAVKIVYNRTKKQ